MRDVFKLFEGWRRFNNQDHYSVGMDPFYGPPPVINDVVDCWVNKGIRFYNTVHNTNGISYNTTLPTEELEFHIENDMRMHDLSFLGQQMIQDGMPPRSVRVYVGKNGRAIINEDAEIVLAAKQVGLTQLPVLFYFKDEV